MFQPHSHWGDSNLCQDTSSPVQECQDSKLKQKQQHDLAETARPLLLNQLLSQDQPGPQDKFSNKPLSRWVINW